MSFLMICIEKMSHLYKNFQVSLLIGNFSIFLFKLLFWQRIGSFKKKHSKIQAENTILSCLVGEIWTFREK